ncbi:CocE/NonD family hydrolase [Halorientalis marina]|uniref:CocE/NonD family hydrolase n=1 Tax=Halorientalis marina TaxID=2931976 RepID=UPI001FF28EF4|nr:CocE/NonD family hydrolase [Halorientalis marina]
MTGDNSGIGSTGMGSVNRRNFLRSTGVLVGGLTLGSGTAAAGRSGFGVSTEDYTISSWDGTDLEATLYTPDGSGPFPAVLMTHGWGAFRQSPLTAGKALTYAKNGYAVLTYDSRGFGGSDGVVGLDGPKETRDGQALIDWLAGRDEIALEGSGNPKVGMDGISYAGGIQFQVAAADDRVDAIVPRITWNDLNYSLAPNGVVKSGWLTILLGLGTLGTVDGDEETRVTEDLYEWYEESLWNNEVPEDAVEAFESRSVACKDDFDTPTYLVQGWDDTLFKPNEALWTYNRLQDEGVDSRLAFYEGGHAVEEIAVPLDARNYMNQRAVDWMDIHLRGESRDVPQTASWLKSSDEFRTDPQFPPAGVSDATYELGDADRDGDDRIERWSWFYDESVTYSWSVGEDIEVVGVPSFDLTFDVKKTEARLFFNLLHNGEKINDVGEVYRIPDEGQQRIQFEYPALQRFVSAGDTLGLKVSVSNPFYLDSRESDGVVVQPSESRIHLPQRPQ